MRAILFPSLVLALSGCAGGIINNDPVGNNDSGGDQGAPNIHVETAEIDFEEVNLGSTGSASLNLQNNGASTLTVLGIESDNSVFSATAGAGLQVAAGLTTSVGLKFLPTAKAALPTNHSCLRGYKAKIDSQLLTLAGSDR